MSKKCLAIAKKAMVWTLAASMLVATPLTASAAGLRGVYSVSDGWNDDTNESMTGTVTNTDTNTNSGVLKDNELSIMGIVLDKSHVDVEVGGKRETLTATVVIDGELKDKDGNVKTDEVLAELTRKIKWEVLNPDGTINADTNKILSISATTKGDRSQITLNPRRGTKAGEDMIVRAKIDGRYSYDSVEEKLVLTENATEGYSKTATVSIKQYGDFVYKDIPEQYVKHTLTMNDWVTRDPETANDEIAWEISTMSPKGCAKINNAGVLTFVKEGTVTVKGTTEKGISHVSDPIKISAGYPVSSIVIVDPDKINADFNGAQTKKDVEDNYAFTDGKNKKNKTDIDLGKDDENPFDAEVVLFSKVKIQDPAKPTREKTVELREGQAYTKLDENKQPVQVEAGWEITDDISWSSSKTAVATVGAVKDGAEVEALSAGSAVITAKATSNKSAKLTVTVTATMARDGLSFNWDENTVLHSGQSVDLNEYLVRKPEGNRDALTWTVPDSTQKKSGSVNSKGIFKVANTVAVGEVTVKVQGKKAYTDEEGSYKPEATVTIKVEQGNIRGITITEEETDTVIAKADVDSRDKVVQDADVKSATKNSTDVPVPTGRTYVAKVTEGSTGDASSLVWKHNDPKGKVIDFTNNEDGTVSIKAKAKGKVKFTVSGVYKVTKGDKTSGKAISTTFTVNVLQPVETIKLNKTLVVLNQKDHATKGTQPQKVSLKATLGPKGVNTKEPVIWSVKQIAGTADGTPEKLVDNKGKEITKTSVSVTLTKPITGNVYEITARTASGASATTIVKVLKQTDKVILAKDKDVTSTDSANIYGKSVDVYPGGTLPLFPMIKLKAGNELYAPDTFYCESVEYSVSKKGIITIDSDGTIHAIKKGNVTITVKTPTNKKATLKVNVKQPLG